jgi:hypothetical protein
MIDASLAKSFVSGGKLSAVAAHPRIDSVCTAITANEVLEIQIT